jgi:hypothetical protein
MTYKAAPKPEPIPLEKQHAVILARLNDAGDRVRAAQADIDTAHNRLNAVRRLAYGAMDRKLDFTEQMAMLAALEAIGRAGGDDLSDVSENLDGLDFRDEVTAEDVAELEQEQAHAATMAEMKALREKREAEGSAA